MQFISIKEIVVTKKISVSVDVPHNIRCEAKALKWDAVEGADRYLIYHLDSASSPTPVNPDFIIDATNTSFTNGEKGLEYFYWRVASLKETESGSPLISDLTEPRACIVPEISYDLETPKNFRCERGEIQYDDEPKPILRDLIAWDGFAGAYGVIIFKQENPTDPLPSDPWAYLYSNKDNYFNNVKVGLGNAYWRVASYTRDENLDIKAMSPPTEPLQCKSSAPPPSGGGDGSKASTLYCKHSSTGVETPVKVTTQISFNSSSSKWLNNPFSCGAGASIECSSAQCFGGVTFSLFDDVTSGGVGLGEYGTSGSYSCPTYGGALPAAEQGSIEWGALANDDGTPKIFDSGNSKIANAYKIYYRHKFGRSNGYCGEADLIENDAGQFFIQDGYDALQQ